MYHCSCKEVPQEDPCSTVLKYTVYAPSTLWINSSNLDDEISQLNKLPGSVTCREFLTVFNCTIRFPACNANETKVVPICPSDCPLIDLRRSQCVLVLNEYSDFQILKEFLNSFNCDDSRTYYNFHRSYVETNLSDCVTLSKS